jgi:hypothetical protein
MVNEMDVLVCTPTSNANKQKTADGIHDFAI